MLVAKKRPAQLPRYEQRITERREANWRHSLTASLKLKIFGMMFVGVLAAVSLIAHHTYVVHLNHQIINSNNELQSLKDQGRHLRLETASLRSPERLEKMALEIGMIYPGRDQVIVLTAADHSD